MARHLYPKHMQYFAAGPTHRERLILAANRVGKTEYVGGYEMSLHLTGRYPDWWTGRRFSHGIQAWAAGNTKYTTRDIIQFKMLGPIDRMGTGNIPADAILGTRMYTGVPEAVEVVKVRHVSGDVSVLKFKSYEQGRSAFEGTEIHVIWCDEEPPLDVYVECLTRTMATGTFEGGMILLTFTPLMGMSEVVLAFLPGGKLPEERSATGKYVVSVTWDDVPHLSETEKAELLASYPLHQRDARSKGVPQLGAGAIYPIPEDDVVVADFAIPAHWPRFYALDVGWNRTAVGWYALDRDTDTLYRYAEHYRGQAEPDVHAAAIRARGEWLHGVIDPASRGRSQHDGEQLVKKYRERGLHLHFANNAVEAGIFETWQRMSTGRLKVFKSCGHWFEEFRLYRRDDKGRIVKENDHCMDETRYAVMSGIAQARTKPVETARQTHAVASGRIMPQGSRQTHAR